MRNSNKFRIAGTLSKNNPLGAIAGSAGDIAYSNQQSAIRYRQWDYLFFLSFSNNEYLHLSLLPVSKLPLPPAEKRI